LTDLRLDDSGRNSIRKGSPYRSRQRSARFVAALAVGRRLVRVRVRPASPRFLAPGAVPQGRTPVRRADPARGPAATSEARPDRRREEI